MNSCKEKENYMISVNQIFFSYEKELVGSKEIPLISWKIHSDEQGVEQKAYRLQMSVEPSFATLVVDTGLVETNQSVGILVPDIKLQSLTTYYCRVKILSNKEIMTEWSRTNSFTTAYLENSEWIGQFISAETIEEKDRSAGTYLRKEFNLGQKVAQHGAIKKAVLCSTALGIYHIYINGNKVGEDQLAPGWTSYKHHLLYQMYEVTELLQENENAIGALVGAGWYKGLMGFLGLRNNYGEQTALLADLSIWYEDGTKDIIATDKTWQGASSPVTFSEIYDGEIYDARLEIEGWNLPCCVATMFHPVEVVPYDFSVLQPQGAGRVTVDQTIPVKEIITTPKGETVLDFGQNLTGWITMKCKGNAGDRVELHCFETLDSQGNAYYQNLRKAKQTLIYICKEGEEATYAPYFTFQGFRYAQVICYPGEVNKEQFIANVVHTKMAPTGQFSCSNPEVNQLQHNILWGLKGNFVDIPSDCPQRNERMGWTGDAQIFCRTASYLMNTYTFFSKWLKDVAADQTEEGGVPHVVPDIISCTNPTDWLLGQGTHSAAAWADVAVINPWTLYMTYGDTKILEEQYESMKAWIDFMHTHANGVVWNYKLQFGDWVALDAAEGSYYGATPNDLTCTAYYAYSTGLFAKIAAVLGKEKDATYYHQLHQEIKKGYQELFFDQDGSLTAQTQTAHIISLYFGLVPEQYKKKIAADLVRLLEKEGGHLVTGFVGTPYFCHALSENGYVEEAYDLLLKEDFPSWLYQVKMGATTVWEHWDGLKPDGTMWSPDMNSFNHYAYGAIGEWLYRVVAGIEIDETNPGYKHFFIQPRINEKLEYVDAVYDSVYGEIKIRWHVKEDVVTLDLTVPCNTTATIRLFQVKAMEEYEGFCVNQDSDGKRIIEKIIGSGNYHFEYIKESNTCMEV